MALAARHYHFNDRAGIAASKEAIGAGIVAGLIAGSVMGLVAMFRAALDGPGFFAPMKLIAATFYGPDALLLGVGPILLGMLFHLFNAAVFGLVFSLLVGRRWSIGGALGAGVVWGLILWLVMTWLVLPWANPLMYDAMMEIPGWWFFYHLVYGATLALTPPLAAAFAHRKYGRDDRDRPAGGTLEGPDRRI